jgi:putative PIN family toxin of toxin-antitoxin system
VRAVLDPNVIISGALSPAGAPSEVLRALAIGEFELIASDALLAELQRALAYPKLRARIAEGDAAELVRWVGDSATLVPDPIADAPVHSADLNDDYLIALSAAHRAALVSGDKHLLALADDIPVFSPRGFLELLAQARDRAAQQIARMRGAGDGVMSTEEILALSRR